MRILLAEDEPELATWLARALERSGLLTDWVSDGRDVLPSLAARRYDALVLDLGLPGLDGHQVLAALRATDQRLPVLILTARDSLIERVGTLNQGADDFLAKPFDLAALGPWHDRITAFPVDFSNVGIDDDASLLDLGGSIRLTQINSSENGTRVLADHAPERVLDNAGRVEPNAKL